MQESLEVRFARVALQERFERRAIQARPLDVFASRRLRRANRQLLSGVRHPVSDVLLVRRSIRFVDRLDDERVQRRECIVASPRLHGVGVGVGEAVALDHVRDSLGFERA